MRVWISVDMWYWKSRQYIRNMLYFSEYFIKRKNNSMNKLGYFTKRITKEEVQ